MDQSRPKPPRPLNSSGDAADEGPADGRGRAFRRRVASDLKLKLKLPRFRGVLRDLVQVGSAVATSLAAS
jgi:hypothetical protein